MRGRVWRSLRFRTVLSLRYCQWLAFSGRPAGRPVYAPLRVRAPPPPGISPLRGPRLAAPPLGPRGLVSVPPFPLLGHRVGGRLRYASQARGAAAGASPGARPAPRRYALRDPRPRPAPPDPLPSTYASIYVRACRSGRRYVRRRSAVFTSRGDVRSLPVTTSHQWGDVVPSRRAVCSPRPTRRSTCVRAGRAAATLADARRCSPQGGTRALPPSHPPLSGGDGGGTWSALGKRRAGPALKGGEAGLGPVLSLSRTCSW